MIVCNWQNGVAPNLLHPPKVLCAQAMLLTPLNPPPFIIMRVIIFRCVIIGGA